MSLSKKGAKQHFLRLFEIIDFHFRSEIHAVMTGGFATIAGTVLAAYISFGIPAAQLISASVMAAPTALAVSKLIYPETEESKTTVKDIKMEKGPEKTSHHREKKSLRAPASCCADAACLRNSLQCDALPVQILSQVLCLRSSCCLCGVILSCWFLNAF